MCLLLLCNFLIKSSIDKGKLNIYHSNCNESSNRVYNKFYDMYKDCRITLPLHRWLKERFYLSILSHKVDRVCINTELFTESYNLFIQNKDWGSYRCR